MCNSLSALVCVGLRYRAAEPHLELIAAQRRVPIVADEAVKAVEHQVVGQVETSGTGLLARVDPAVLHTPRTPEEGEEELIENEKHNVFMSSTIIN